MQFTSAGDNVLASFGNPGLHARVGLGQALKTFDEFRQVGGVLNLNSDLYDRGDREPHNPHVMSSFRGSKSPALQQELIDTDETDDIASRAIFNGLNVATHHEHSTLDGLDEKIVLLSGEVVGTLDTNFGPRLDSSREHTAEGIEASFIGGGYHLGDVEDKRTLGVAVTDTDSRLVVHGTFVESLNTITLSGSRGWKVDDYHLQEGVTSGQKFTHDDLEEGLAFEITLIRCEFDIEFLKHGADGVLLEVHDSIKDLEDGVKNEAVEGTFEGFAVSVSADGGPLAGGRVEEVIAPELKHHLILVHTKFLGVSAGELAKGKAPAVKTRSESDSSLIRVYLDIAQGDIMVGGDDDVHVLDGTLEGLVEGFFVDLEFEKGTVDLVDDNNRLDTLGKGLTEHGFCLYANTLNAIYYDEGTVCNTESSSDF